MYELYQYNIIMMNWLDISSNTSLCMGLALQESAEFIVV